MLVQAALQLSGVLERLAVSLEEGAALSSEDAGGTLRS